MKNSVTPSRIFRGVAFGLVMTGLGFSLLPARAQSTAAPEEPKAERAAATQTDLDSLFDVRKPHIPAKKSAACPAKPGAPCGCQPAAAACAKVPAGCPSPAVAQVDPLAADVAALFDVQVVPTKARKVKSEVSK